MFATMQHLLWEKSFKDHPRGFVVQTIFLLSLATHFVD
jgi:hypothetical protein